MSIFKACDIRGVVGEELNEDVARRIGLGLGEMIRRRGGGAVCLGGDFRRSTAPLKRAVLGGLLDAGVHVMDVGQAPTPVTYFAASHLRVSNVVIVTASHNAGRYNGVKFMVAGRPAVPELVAELESLTRTASPSAAEKRAKSVSAGVDPFYEAQVRTLAASVGQSDEAALAARRPRIVLDAMGGAFAEIAPRVLAAAGVEVVPHRCAIDPDFASHDPNPAVDENLRPLIDAVSAKRADLGLALDGDGDRAAFVDHEGQIVRPEQIGAVLIHHCFPKPTVVYDLKCASIFARAAREAGGEAVMQPSGHGFIKTTMIERSADLGVEVSGHYFFRTLGGGDDGLFVSLVVAHLLARTGLSLADLVRPVPWPAITRDLRLPLSGDGPAMLARIAATCGGAVRRLDGVRAEYEDGWGLARLSITEPLITMRFEGRDRPALEQVVGRFLSSEPALRGRVMEMIG